MYLVTDRYSSFSRVHTTSTRRVCCADDIRLIGGRPRVSSFQLQ